MQNYRLQTNLFVNLNAVNALIWNICVPIHPIKINQNEAFVIIFRTIDRFEINK